VNQTLDLSRQFFEYGSRQSGNLGIFGVLRFDDVAAIHCARTERVYIQPPGRIPNDSRDARPIGPIRRDGMP
jgi:hypothetical protein